MADACNFQCALKSVLENRGISARQFAIATGVDPSVISRLAVSRIEIRQLSAILRFFDADKPTYIELIRAHFWDELVRIGANPEAFWAQVANGDYGWLASIPPGMQGNLQLIGTVAKTNRWIAGALESLASSIMVNLAEVADAEQAIERGQALEAHGEQGDVLPLVVVPSVGATHAPKPQKKPRKNAGAPSRRRILPPESKAS